MLLPQAGSGYPTEQRLKADEVPRLVHSEEEVVFVTAEFCGDGARDRAQSCSTTAKMVGAIGFEPMTSTV
jgi:hypothetical protein